eukprot:COSAG06_NODE_1609_length_8943_cov_90.568182_11_plen_94_part_00
MQPLGCSLSSSFFSDICRFRCGCIAVPYYTLYEHTRGSIVCTTHALNVWAASLKWLRCAGLAGLLAVHAGHRGAMPLPAQYPCVERFSRRDRR